MESTIMKIVSNGLKFVVGLLKDCFGFIKNIYDWFYQKLFVFCAYHPETVAKAILGIVMAIIVITLVIKLKKKIIIKKDNKKSVNKEYVYFITLLVMGIVAGLVLISGVVITFWMG